MSEQRSRTAGAALVGAFSAGRARPDQLPGGKHGLTPEQVASSQRERVLAAMRELVAGGSYQEVPVAAVIRHAGVSRKTFYELYAGKEECFVALYERELERLLEPVLRAFEGDEPWVDRLRTALGVLLGGLAADEDAARICFVEALAAGPLALERRNAAMTRLDPLFAPPGADPVGARAITAGAVGYLSETLSREIAAGRAAELPALRSELMATLTLPFTGPPRPAADAAPDGANLTADAAGEPAFLTAYGAAAAELLGRVAAAMTADRDSATRGDADVSGPADPATRIRAGVAALLDFCATEPDSARVWLVESFSAGPAARERRAETARALSDLFAQPLRELRPSDRIAQVSAIALVGGFQELAFDAVDRRAHADLPTVDSVVAVARLGP